MRRPNWFTAMSVTALLSSGGCVLDSDPPPRADPDRRANPAAEDGGRPSFNSTSGGGFAATTGGQSSTGGRTTTGGQSTSGTTSSSGRGEVLDVEVQARLVVAEDCPDLLSQLQMDAVAKLDLEIETFKANLEWQRMNGGGFMGGTIGGGSVTGVGTGGWFPDDGFAADAGAAEDDAVDFAGPTTGGTPGVANTTGSGGLLGGAMGTTGGTGETGIPQSAGEPISSPVGGSDTNNQVKDVDEADFVKMVEDYTGFYLLHGSQLFAFDSWPASDLAQRGAPTRIEGQPVEMFVRDGEAVVFSRVNPYELPGDTFSDSRVYQQYTKVTVLDVGSAPMQTTRELYVEGSYTSSRRYDATVRVVMQSQSPAPNRFYPQVQTHDDWGRPYDDAFVDAQLDGWRERTEAAIQNTELSDWLPRQYERDDAGALQEIAPACDTHYMPLAGASDYGLTRVLTLDLDDADAAPRGLTVMGGSSVVYSNRDTMVLAHNDYRWDDRDFGMLDEQRTALHSFAVDGAQTTYTASGWAPGHVLNQFALDVRDGVVRLSTTGWFRENPDATPQDPGFWNNQVVNQVLTMGVEDGQLSVLGSSGPIGHEGETTRSTRFIDDRAYVVTFRQTDPLILVDLSDPTQLPVLGELEIPGFSEYIHPLEDGHLLTIGQNADSNGRVTGLMLQIFDVRDATAPKLSHRHSFAPNTSSAASYDHKAFTFYDEGGLLAFPMVDYGAQFSSTLQVFRVSTEAGFEALGAVDHTALMQDCLYEEPGYYVEFTCYYQPDVRRGMFVEGEDDTLVYTVSYAGVTAHSLADLDAPLGSVELPIPDTYYGGFPGFGGWDGPFVTGGGFAMPTPAGGFDAGVAVDDDGVAE